MAVTDKARYGKNGIKELTGILEKIDALLLENRAEICYDKILFEQGLPAPRATITIMLK